MSSAGLGGLKIKSAQLQTFGTVASFLGKVAEIIIKVGKRKNQIYNGDWLCIMKDRTVAF